MGIGGLLVPVLLRAHSCAWSDITSCTEGAPDSQPALAKLESSREVQGKSYLVRALRSVGRVIYLCVMFGPLLLTWPLRKFELTSKYWWAYCVFAAEASGAVVIKLAQWASSRPDLFGADVCDRFKFLQDRTRPHPWADTERMLDASLGENWRSELTLENVPVGSGCIAQVYRGSVREDDIWRPVAVKVLHPGVRTNVQSDIDLLRGFGKLLQSLPRVRWLNPEGMIDEFAHMLSMQMDLRGEARNLNRFRENFAGDQSWDVVFPEPMPRFTTADVLVETFIEGKPFLVGVVEPWQ